MKEFLRGFTRIASYFILGVALIAVYKTFDNINVIISFVGRIIRILNPFVIGLGLAFLMYAPTKWLEKWLAEKAPQRVKKYYRLISVLTVYFILILIIALLLIYALPALIKGTVDFVSSLPKYYNELIEFLNTLTEKDGLLEGYDVTQAVEELYTSYIEPRFTTDAVIGYFKGLMNFTTSILNIFMAFIISIYMLLSRESLVRTGKIILSLFLKKCQLDTLAKYTHRSCEILYSYFYSQALDAFIVGAIMTIGLIIFRAPSAPLLGFIIGLMNMIPYFGAIIGGCLAVGITLLSGNLYGAIFVAIYVIAMQQVDANLIQPRIVGHTLGVRPIYVLFAITLCGGLFGFWGIFLGVPIIAIIQMLFRDYLAYRQRERKTIRPSD
jgi:predicted PurR-regulated permease PerM